VKRISRRPHLLLAGVGGKIGLRRENVGKREALKKKRGEER